MGKFRTTSSSLFNKNEKGQVPDWMTNLTDNLKIKDKQVDFEVEKPRGAFAQSQTVYRPEGDASLRKIAHNYNENKLVASSKIELAKFLTGKYYKVKNSFAGTDLVTLEVNIDGVPSNFQFPYEIRNNKLYATASFFGNEGEYPFSKAGFEECLQDIKSNKVKESRRVEAVGKTFLINREEIVRRFNGSLRQATDTINELLNEGIIVGAGSNTYASFHDVDQLFPQLEKEASEDKIAEFHFSPNQEHVATNELKPANVLSVEASKILSQHFTDFIINQAVRDNNELLVKATVLNNSNVRNIVDFSFDIVSEKIAGIKVAELNDKRMSLKQLIDHLNEKNMILAQYSKFNKVSSTRSYDNIVFTRKDVKERLNKVVASSKIDRIIESWAAKELITQINSTTFTTKLSFEELLSKTVVAKVLSFDEIEKIEAQQRHFGEGLEVERDEKEVLERIREVDELESSDETKLANLQSTLSKQFKNFVISNFKKEASIYVANLQFTHNGIRNMVKIDIDFKEGNPVVTANISNKKLSMDKLAEAFGKSELLTAYLNTNKASLTSESILTTNMMMKKLANIVSEDEIEELISSWINNNLLVSLGDNRFASNHSFEELLEKSNVKPISELELANRIARAKRDRGMEVRSSHVEDTGSRQAEESWSAERMAIHASQQIGSMFKDFDMLSVDLDDNSYSVVARIVNPINGLKNKLTFSFSMVNGLPKDLYKVSSKDLEVNPKNIMDILENKDEAINQFTSLNQVSNRSHKTIINRSRLESMLKTVVSSSDLKSTIDLLVGVSLLNPINSNEYASEKSMSEIIAFLSEKKVTDVEAGKNQISLSIRDENKVDLRGSHVKETDTRTLDSKEMELSPEMLKVQAKLQKAVTLAEKAKKITANKSVLLQKALSEAKSGKDLDIISKNLKRYL